MKKAHVFQEKFTGLQMFVYGANDVDEAQLKLSGVVSISSNWLFLCEKIAINV